MNSNHPQKTINEDKWQHMSLIVAHHLHHDSVVQLDKQFKTLSIKRFIAENLLLCLLQYTGLMLMTLSYPPAPIWFASGVATAFVFMRGVSILGGIWLGSFFAYSFTHIGFVLAFDCATIDTFQSFLLLWLTHRFITPTLIFYRFYTFMKFLLCASLLTALTALLLELACYSHMHHPITAFQMWVQWWLANLDGILIISLAIVTWDFYFPDVNHIKNLNKIALSLSFGMILVLSIVLINSSTPLLIILSVLFTLPVLVFISLNYGWSGAVAAMFMLGFILNFSAYFNTSLFSANLPATTFILIQLLLGLAVVMYSSLTLIRQQHNK